MHIIIHFNTFFGDEAEINKMDIIDAVETHFGTTAFIEQVFENPDDESDGFDLYIKYPSLENLDLDFLKDLVNDLELYVLVYDLDLKLQHGYWFDEADDWMTSDLSDATVSKLNAIFRTI